MNPLKLLGLASSRSKRVEKLAHMTYASQTISRSLSRTGIFLRANIWIWPIIATVLLGVIAFLLRSAIESTMKENLRSQVQTLLNVEVGMLENWLKVQTSNATSLANTLPVRQPIYKLLENAEPGKKSTNSPEVEQDLLSLIHFTCAAG